VSWLGGLLGGWVGRWLGAPTEVDPGAISAHITAGASMRAMAHTTVAVKADAGGWLRWLPLRRRSVRLAAASIRSTARVNAALRADVRQGRPTSAAARLRAGGLLSANPEASAATGCRAAGAASLRARPAGAVRAAMADRSAPDVRAAALRDDDAEVLYLISTMNRVRRRRPQFNNA
jgi:hypothetical protein